jgi:peroxidase
LEGNTPPFAFLEFFLFSAQLAAIRKMTMSKVICQNSDTMSQIQRGVFDLPDTFQNTHVGCEEIPELDLTPWQEVSGCEISGNILRVGETKRVSPCISCTCTSNGPDCRSLSIKSCADLAQDFTQEQILADDVCKVQCTKDFFDSARGDNVDTKFSFSS